MSPLYVCFLAQVRKPATPLPRAALFDLKAGVLGIPEEERAL